VLAKNFEDILGVDILSYPAVTFLKNFVILEVVLVFHNFLAKTTKDRIHTVHFVLEFVGQFELEMVIVVTMFMLVIQEFLVVALYNEESFQYIVQRPLNLSSSQHFQNDHL
jgi:hypothetical protein